MSCTTLAGRMHDDTSRASGRPQADRPFRKSTLPVERRRGRRGRARRLWLSLVSDRLWRCHRAAGPRDLQSLAGNKDPILSPAISPFPPAITAQRPDGELVIRAEAPGHYVRRSGHPIRSIASSSDLAKKGFFRYAIQPVSCASRRDVSQSIAVMKITGSFVPDDVNCRWRSIPEIPPR